MRWGFKGFYPLKIPAKGAALLTPALRSAGQRLPDWVVKSVFVPRDERAREDFVKVKIDVLMATYNGEKYLREQLDSILEQSYGDFRLLISDDGSEDATREILNEYVGKDSRVVVFLQNKNVGSTRNFEFLMKKVENECFMFSDQDDIWQKDKIQKSIDKMNQTDSDLVYTNLQVVDEDLQVLNPSYWRLKGFEKKVRKYNNFESLYLNNYITGSTMLVKSKWLEKILPLPEKSKYILHDYWTALVVSKWGKMAYVDEPLVKYRQHMDNRIGSKRKSDEIKDFKQMRDLFIEVKLDHFKTLMQNEDAFEDEDLANLNKLCYPYFEHLKKVKKVNFKNQKLFWKLYKYEKFSYAFQNDLILNFPYLAKPLFAWKKGWKNRKV